LTIRTTTPAEAKKFQDESAGVTCEILGRNLSLHFFFAHDIFASAVNQRFLKRNFQLLLRSRSLLKKKRFWPTGTWKEMLLDVTCIYLSPVTSKQLEAQLTSLWWELIHKAMAGTCSNAMHSTLKPKKNPKKNRDPGFWFQ
jgi:hypothetical protein